jgi:hypothetical protein
MGGYHGKSQRAKTFLEDYLKLPNRGYTATNEYLVNGLACRLTA